MDDVGKSLGYKTYSDWYSISQKQIIDNGGSKFLHMHKNSVIRFFHFVC